MTWQALKKGDLIDIIAPGSAVPDDVLEAAVITVQTLGFTPRVPNNLLSPYLFHSNTDENRAEHLVQALSAKDSKAVWCLRGGYGSLRLIPSLLKASKPRRTKLFIGISDVSSIHFFLNQIWNWPSLHASLLDRVARGRVPGEIVEEMIRILRGEQSEVVFGGLKPLNDLAKSTQELEGNIRGGNLTVLQSHIGTGFRMKTKDCFLFLEDRGERGYRVDRMLEHFSQSGVLKDCRGILFGQFIEGYEPSEAGAPRIDLVPQALSRFALTHPEIPVWTGVQSGHDVQLRPLPFETPAVLHNSVLTIQTGLKVVN